VQIPLVVSVLAMLYLGIFPDAVLASATAAVKAMKF